MSNWQALVSSISSSKWELVLVFSLVRSEDVRTFKPEVRADQCSECSLSQLPAVWPVLKILSLQNAQFIERLCLQVVRKSPRCLPTNCWVGSLYTHQPWYFSRNAAARRPRVKINPPDLLLCICSHQFRFICSKLVTPTSILSFRPSQELLLSDIKRQPWIKIFQSISSRWKKKPRRRNFL